MAEERLIDDDKDRKYKIRKNADGEDELVIDDSPTDETDDEESDIPVFEIPVYAEDDEEAAYLTPEQLAERERIKRDEEAERAEKLKAFTDRAQKNIEEGDYESAQYTLKKAETFAGNNGGYYCLKLEALTRRFTDFTLLERSAEAAEGVRLYATAEQKQALKELCAPYKEKLAEAEQTVYKLHVENEQKKAERRTAFAQIASRAKRNFCIAAAPFAVLLILAIVFATMIFSAENGTFLILTAVFASLAVVALFITLFTVRKLLEAKRNVKLNEKDTSTKLGREYLNEKTKRDNIKSVLTSFNDDIS